MGSVGEMMKEKAEWKSDRIGVGGGAGKKEKDKEKGDEETKRALQAGAVIRRPGQTTGRGGRRGGLGLKRGGAGLNAGRASGDSAGGGDERTKTEANGSVLGSGDQDKEKTGAKSNADFKAMFLKS